jgi:hypothetical protein
MKKSFLAAVIVFGLSVTTSAQAQQSELNEIKACGCHEDAATRNWDLVTISKNEATGLLSKEKLSSFSQYNRDNCQQEIQILIESQLCPRPAAETKTSEIKTLGNACVIVKNKYEGDSDNMVAMVFGPGSEIEYDIYVGDKKKYSLPSGSAAKDVLKSLVKQGVCK